MAGKQQGSAPPLVELVIHSPSSTLSRESSYDSSADSNLKDSSTSTCSILSKFHAGYFRISLSFCSQALLWKSLGNQPENARFLHWLLKVKPSTALIFLWSLALVSTTCLFLLYILRCIFHFDKVKAEFTHSVSVNYMFAPWISCLFLIMSCPLLPPTSTSYLVLWWIFVTPILILDVKIYGQWFTKGKRYLSSVANPTSLLSVMGNLAGAWAASDMGSTESGLFMFSLGATHFLVLFVTLYQGLEGSRWVGANLKPVFFLFFAAPSMASLTWHSLAGSFFDTSSKLLYFLAIFLCISLVCRPGLFRKSMKKYSVAWWEYSFPLTILALDSAEYARQVKGTVPYAAMLFFSSVSVLVNLILVFYGTVLNMKFRHLFLAKSSS